MKQILIVPSYNSNDQLSNLIRKIRDTDNDIDILVVDDGSVVPVSLEVKGVRIIRNDRNMGKGLSLVNGFKYSLINGYTHAVTMDSDLQHLPSELVLFLKNDENIDFVLGYREKDSTMPIHRKFSNFVTSLIISFICRRDIIDSQCGFRRYRLASISNTIFKERGFQFESEVLIRCISKLTTLNQVKIATVYDDENKSYINHMSDTVKFIKLIARSSFL